MSADVVEMGDWMLLVVCFFFFKQKTAYEMRISDWSSDVCSSDLVERGAARLDRLLDQVLHQRLELGPGQLDVQVLGAGGVGRHVRQVDFGLLRAGQLD